MAQLLSTSINGNLSITGTTTVYGNIVPGYSGNYDLGSSNSCFRYGYFNGAVNTQTLRSDTALYVYGGTYLFLSAPSGVTIATPGNGGGGVTVDANYFILSTANGNDATFNVGSYINLNATAMIFSIYSYINFYKLWGNYPGTSLANNTLVQMTYTNGSTNSYHNVPFAVGVEHNIELAQATNFWVKFSLFDVTGSDSSLRNTTVSSTSTTVGQYLSKLASLLYYNGYKGSTTALPVTGLYWGSSTTSRTIAGIYASGTTSTTIGFKVYNNLSEFGTGVTLNIYQVACTRYVYLYDMIRMPQQ